MLPGNNGLMYRKSQLLKLIGYSVYAAQLGSNLYSALPQGSIPGAIVGYMANSYSTNSGSASVMSAYMQPPVNGTKAHAVPEGQLSSGRFQCSRLRGKPNFKKLKKGYKGKVRKNRFKKKRKNRYRSKTI